MVSAVQSPNMSHVLYSKQRRGRNHNREPEENVKAPELVKEYWASRDAQARASLLKPGPHTSNSPMTTRPSPPTRLASSEIHHRTLGGHHIDGIQEALKGSSEVQKVWYNNSSPYTSREARTAAINAEGHADAGASAFPKHTLDPYAAA